ncbi:MAG: DUF5674 family protein [Elusimicrobiota bacterium]|nr:DUF5674 family protein [Elusimicrobiota bacterium]
MKNMKIIREKTTKEEMLKLAEEYFGDMVKVVVDIEREIIGAGGELHTDAEELLLKDGSKQEDLWGINYYPHLEDDARIEYSAVINIRPRNGNYSFEIQNETVREKIKKIVDKILP